MEPNDNKTYFEKEYLTLEELADRSGLDQERVLEFVETQCVPPHSYEITSTTTINCHFKGPFPTDSSRTRYYNPSLVSWIQNANALVAENMSLSDVAKHVREQFNRDYEATFNNRDATDCMDLDRAWRYLMDGTWGICLKEVSIPYMANKELSCLSIDKLCRMDEPSHQLTSDEKAELKLAVEQYESVTKPFPPHLIPTSSRTCKVEPAIKKYLAC